MERSRNLEYSRNEGSDVPLQGLEHEKPDRMMHLRPMKKKITNRKRERIKKGSLITSAVNYLQVHVTHGLMSDERKGFSIYINECLMFMSYFYSITQPTVIEVGRWVFSSVDKHKCTNWNQISVLFKSFWHITSPLESLKHNTYTVNYWTQFRELTVLLPEVSYLKFPESYKLIANPWNCDLFWDLA